MRVFFQCVAEAVCENGLKGLAEMVPGGKFAYDVAEGAWKKYRERREKREQHEELAKLAQATLDEVKAAAVEAVRGVATDAADDIIDLQLYLTAIPDAVRQSLKRPEDPTGTTVPPAFALNSADDVLKLLPPRPPRFRPGAALPGKPGWVLDRLLGTGGFGEVWFARHARMGSLFGAVKFCFGQSARDLIHEANLIDQLVQAGWHPNIVPLLDAHLEGECSWLLFEYVGGGSLTDWIYRLAGRTEADRLAMSMAALAELCETVAYFHALPVPVVHRDLKPSNILLDGDDRLRITDFGIGSVMARETNRQESRGGGTRGGRLLTYLRGSYTPLYSSPQQRSGSDPDPRDDVHALGVIAYQMLTGHLAQGAGPDFADDLRDAGAGEELIALLGKCVAQKPERRPKDAREVLQPLLKMIETDRLRRDVEEYERDRKRGRSTEYFFEAHALGRFSAWLAAAESGNAAAMVLVANAMNWGIGTRYNEQGAAIWYQKAAYEGGNAAAMVYQGDHLVLDSRLVRNSDGTVGYGMEDRSPEGVEWYRKAVQLGDAPAMCRLGKAYADGTGVEESHTEAVRWFRQAADLGNTNAMSELSDAFRDGNGVVQDDEEAIRWKRRAAEHGNLLAQLALSIREHREETSK